MQNLKLTVGSTFFVKNGNRGKILFKQPPDVTDMFPFVGYILEDSGHKAGMAWNEAGENSEGVEADYVDSVYNFNADLGQWVKNHSSTIIYSLNIRKDGGDLKAKGALEEYAKLVDFGG